MAPRTPRRPLFLEKAHYRRSRAMDAARILPVVGFVLLLLPILWTGNASIGITQAAVFIFGLWGVMIAGAMVLSRLLRDPPTTRARDTRPSGTDDPR